MKPDQVLAEVWRTKDKLAAEAHYDVATLFDHLRETERTSGRNYVSFGPWKHDKRRKIAH